MKRRPTDRQRVHLDRGGGVFIPLDRMARIRWEESVLRAKLAREGHTAVTFQHGTCHCGSIECVGVPHATSPTHWSFLSPQGRELAVAHRGVILEARVVVQHDPEGKFALRVTDPRGRTHHAVSAPDPSWSRWHLGRSVDLPDVVGMKAEGVWRLAVVDHTLGAGEFLRPWSLSVKLAG